MHADRSILGMGSDRSPLLLPPPPPCTGEVARLVGCGVASEVPTTACVAGCSSGDVAAVGAVAVVVVSASTPPPASPPPPLPPLLLLPPTPSPLAAAPALWRAPAPFSWLNRRERGWCPLGARRAY